MIYVAMSLRVETVYGTDIICKQLGTKHKCSKNTQVNQECYAKSLFSSDVLASPVQVALALCDLASDGQSIG